jgi:hypothetical protein
VQLLLPLVLSFVAILAAAVMAYGTDSRWATARRWGLDLIVISRRLQWPMVALSLVACLALLALVISGKRRAWWLIGLLPVLALFGHRFLTSSVNRYGVVDEPAMVAADQATHVGEEDYVVGVVFNGQPYAYPYSSLFSTPVIVQSDREQRMLLVWSPHANAATVLAVTRELKARDLDVVAEPADSLLLYNGRTGEFIVGVNGATPAGRLPACVEEPIAVLQEPWRQWRARPPDTRVMAPPARPSKAPTRPLLPKHSHNATPVVLVGQPPSLAVPADAVASGPLNVLAGEVPVVLFRHPGSGQIRAFDRRLEADLIPRFKSPRDVKQAKGVALIDSDTGIGWSAQGVAVDGPKQSRGVKLKPIEVREDVYLGPARFWYPGLQLHDPSKP